MRSNELSRFGVARPTRSVTLWARQDSDGDEGTNKQNVEDHKQDPHHLRAAGSDTEL